MELENIGHRGKAAYLPYDLTGQGRPMEMPGGGMTRTSGNKDVDASTFYAPACPEHCNNFGGRKHLPPTVPLMQHASPLAYTE